ncbi:5'-nucleotidase [Georgenia satyanarayanai]|uniref:5'-nucleotidase n=1 Tax=Georgenia satyanarayanai TaxID=860221 RepID=A0A2Y9AKU1_9MICO|nr:5'-nucleotidase [Georgenia satyanarayanai]SSA45084.1 5'-nucleotidase [Georgenia satyanarayanai]
MGVASLILTPLVAVAPAAAVMSDGPVFVSEIHYDNDGADEGEAIEVQAPVGTDLAGWQVVLHNGSDGTVYSTTAIDEVVPEAGVVVLDYPSNGIQNGGPDGVALVDAEGAVVELLSYEGVMTAVGGPADGVESTDIGVSEPGSTPAGQSLQRIDGEWTGPAASSFGTVNSADTEPDPDPEPVPEEVTPIAAIQGTGAETPLDGDVVRTRGVVTGVYPEGGFNGAYIQTPGTGADLAGHEASHGVFVFGGDTDLATEVAIGDYVEVVGTAGEYFGLTQVEAQSYVAVDEAVEPVVPAETALPAVDEREAFEGMLLAPQGDFTVTDTYHTNRFGWVGLAAGDEPLRQPTDVVRPRTAEYDTLVAANADREIRMDDGSSHDWTNFDFDNHETPVAYLDPEDPVRVGAPVEFERPVILDYRRTIANQDSTWNLQPQTRLTGADAGDVQPISWENTRPSAEGPAEVGGDVTVATFNVLNYFTSLGEGEDGCGFYGDRAGEPTTARNCDVRGAFDAENLARQTEKIVSAITALDADVVALQEIENSFSFVPGTAPADRDHALSDLVDALNAGAGEERWEYVESATEFPADEDVIRNAFIYQADAVAPVGGTEILLGSDAFDNAREPMAQEFALVDEAGEVVADADTFVVINNHFKSKGSGSGENADQGDGQGASNPDRIEQAQALVAFADDVAADAGTELVLLAGDFNSYTREDPMQVFYDSGYTDLGDELTEKSTYSFGSMVGSLDHVLASEAATAAVTGADVWNINAYESIAFEYSRYNYNVTDFHDDSPYRSSDHDPIIAGLDLVEEPTVDINLLAFNDFHGRLFDYDTDDDGNVTGNATLAFAGTIEELRAEQGEDNTVLFSSGDNIGASLFTSSLQEDRPTIDILGALDLATSAVGNHEFDGGLDNLTGQVSDWADFEYLGANVYGADGEPVLQEFETVEVDGLTVAVIGAVTQETPTLVRPGGIEGLTFGDPVEAVNRVAAQLSDSDAENGEADVIVAAYHEGAGFAEDSSTLEEEVASSEVFAHIVNDTTAEVDAIFNGHTHKVYAWDGPVPGAEGEFRPVIQGESYGEYVSQVVLTVERDGGDVVDYTARNVAVTETPFGELVETYPRVAEVKDILDDALAEAEEIGSEVIGSATADITTAHTTDDEGEQVRDDRGSESTLGNLVADALLAELSAENFGGAEIGVANPGGLRAELYEGDITFAEANAVLPFLNDLWTVTLTGEQFLQLLEQQWQPESASRDYLQLSLSDNVTYTYDPEADRGEHITSVTVDGRPLDPEAEYRIGTFSFLAEGGDNFTAFEDATDVQQTGLLDRDAWISYIETNSPLSPDFARQSTVVTPLPAQLVAGEEVSFEVSGLDLTSLGSPDNTELAVYLVGEDGERGEAAHTAPVTDGAATVTFTVPSDLDGEYTLEMEAAPSGTTVQVPVTVEGRTPAQQYGFFLSNDWSGIAHYAFQYGRHTDEVLIGDWDGNGTDTITVRRGKQYFVNDAPQGGPARSVFTYGRDGDVVLVGDWDGDGVDTLAVRRGAQYHVKNSLRGGDADRVITYGRANDDVLVGDWDGNGTDTFAVRRGATYHVKDRIAGGDADVVLTYGRPGDVTLAGDWDGNGTDTFAIRRDREFHVKNSLRGGPADFAILYGRSGDDVYVGDWNGDGKDTLGVRRTPVS